MRRGVCLQQEVKDRSRLTVELDLNDADEVGPARSPFGPPELPSCRTPR